MVEGPESCRRASTHRDDDLLVGLGGAVTGSEDAGHRGATALVDDDLSTASALHGAFQPLGVGQQADLDEDASQLDGLDLAAGAVLVFQSRHLGAVAQNLSGAGRCDDVDVRQ